MGQNVNKKRKRERERKNRKVAVFPVRNYARVKKTEKNLRNGSPRFIEKTKFSMKSFYTQLLNSRCVSMMNSVILDKVITTKVDWPGRSKNLINEEKGCWTSVYYYAIYPSPRGHVSFLRDEGRREGLPSKRRREGNGRSLESERERGAKYWKAEEEIKRFIKQDIESVLLHWRVDVNRNRPWNQRSG